MLWRRTEKARWWTDSIAVLVCWACAGLLYVYNVDTLAFIGSPKFLSFIYGFGVLTGALLVWSRLTQRLTGTVRQVFHLLLLFLGTLGLFANCAVPSIPGILEAQVRAKVSRVLGLRDKLPPGTMRSEMLPEDPFARPSRLQMNGESTTNQLIWSIGHDKVDQHATLIYDPTNGTVSEGDIIVKK